ncbi:pyrroline-5-carboxylate reductase [Xylophilus sp. Kf1]|nr:pyrroline-5-carboxylate reductase [Xylophilus sp. Kf1]
MNDNRAIPVLDLPVAFVGGGNMASAIIGGLLRQGLDANRIEVVEPFDEARARLGREFSIAAQAEPGPFLSRAAVVVWAVKPQTFREAAVAVAPHAPRALHLSVAAGISSDSIARWLGSGRVVRAMPNTPALVGQGMTGLFARAEVGQADRDLVATMLRPTGRTLWVEAEQQLDAVTALSGSGPAYVFYFLEAMVRAGTEMGLSAEQARELSIATFQGAAHLAAASADPLEDMRQQVTSRGGTTHAAISAMASAGMQDSFVAALHAAGQRARELGEEFGR